MLRHVRAAAARGAQRRAKHGAACGPRRDRDAVVTRGGGTVQRSGPRAGRRVHSAEFADGGGGCTQSRQDLSYALRLLAQAAWRHAVIAIADAGARHRRQHGDLLRRQCHPAAAAALCRSDRLVMLCEKRAAEGVLDNVVSPADFLDWSKHERRASTAMAAMTDRDRRPDRRRRAGQAARSAPCRRRSSTCSASQPMLGRDLPRRKKALVGQHRVVILGHDLWRNRFGADAAVVGRRIMLERHPSRSGRRPAGDLRVSGRPADAVDAARRSKARPQPPQRVPSLSDVYARLKDGVTLERARADMDRVGAQLQAAVSRGQPQSWRVCRRRSRRAAGAGA